MTLSLKIVFSDFTYYYLIIPKLCSTPNWTRTSGLFFLLSVPAEAYFALEEK